MLKFMKMLRVSGRRQSPFQADGDEREGGLSVADSSHNFEETGDAAVEGPVEQDDHDAGSRVRPCNTIHKRRLCACVVREESS